MAQVSIKQVAELAGVSIATVSRCINEPDKVARKTRLKVDEAIHRTGYSPNTLARRFRRGRSNLVVVVLPSVGTPFFADVLCGIHAAAEATGYSILIDDTQGDTITADEITSMVVSKQADGIILLASLSPFGAEIVSADSQRALPVVIGCEPLSPELTRFPAVHVDNEAAAMDVTKHLIDCGHRAIGMICGPEQSLLTKDRELGYRSAMRAAGLDIQDGWVIAVDLTIAGARDATRRLLEHATPPSAIFCANDEMAIGCMHEIKASGRAVPDDVSVVGFDDIPYAEVSDPPLTTVRQPAMEIGRRAMLRLSREIEGSTGDAGDREILPYELVVRSSVAAPKSR